MKLHGLGSQGVSWTKGSTKRWQLFLPPHQHDWRWPPWRQWYRLVRVGGKLDENLSKLPLVRASGTELEKQLERSIAVQSTRPPGSHPASSQPLPQSLGARHVWQKISLQTTVSSNRSISCVALNAMHDLWCQSPQIDHMGFYPRQMRAVAFNNAQCPAVYKLSKYPGG